jgi:hypothetical protein
LSARLVGEIRGDTAAFAQGVHEEVPDDALHRSVVALKEAVAGFRLGPSELSLGKQLYGWGTADSFNPTDYLTPRDYLDPIDSEKMAVYSASARVDVGAAQLTLVVVPVFTPSRLPLADSRWAPVGPAGPTGGATLEDRDLPERNLRNVQYAARLRTTFRGWDLSASYFEGFESTPVFRVSPDAGPAPPRVTPVFTRLRAVGADFSTTWGRLEVHGEGALKFVVRDGRHDRFQVVSGLNYNWDGFTLRWLDRITVIAEYGRELDLSTAEGSGVLGTKSLVRFGLALPDNGFGDTVVGRVAVKFTEDTELRLSGVLSFAGAFSHYVQLKLAHKLVDNLHLEAGVDVFTGAPGESFWGQWHDNDRFFATLKYFF